MEFSKSKSTKRFQFGINRNPASHQRGANIVTIGTRLEYGDKYNISSSNLTMTVKEAKALQSFLNSYLSDEVVS